MVNDKIQMSKQFSWMKRITRVAPKGQPPINRLILKIFLLLITVLLISFYLVNQKEKDLVNESPEVSLASFPTAEGYGAKSVGGRFGRVIYVTNLNDNGPGSLRDAIQQSGPRIILFKVGGIIELSNHIQILNPYITIAGQTAPGDGICLKNAGLDINTHDIIIRHLCTRAGDDPIGPSGENRNSLIDHWGL